MEGREKNPLACINKAFGGGTDLLNGICPNGIPHLLSNCTEELLVYLCYVEAFASRQVIVPLSSDLGLINDKDLLTIRAGVHRIELKVEIDVGSDVQAQLGLKATAMARLCMAQACPYSSLSFLQGFRLAQARPKLKPRLMA